MLQRLVYIERFAVLGACALAPLLTCAWTYQGTTDLQQAGLTLATIAFSLALSGAILGLLFHRLLAMGTVQWGGQQETAALIKMAIGELISGKQDDRLNDAAMAQAKAQEGRATAIYLYNRAAQMRQRGVMKSGKANPISRTKRWFWTVTVTVLGSAAALAPVLLPDIRLQSNPGILAILLLMPLWLTGVAISGLGLEAADNWIRKLRPGHKPVKLRPRSNRSMAGQWHKRDSRADLPVLQIVLLAPVLIAAALYLLREYGPSPGSSSELYAVDVSSTTPKPVPSPPARQATNQQTRRQAAAETPPPLADAQQSNASVQAEQAMATWPQIPPNGSVLQADPETLKYAGWDSNVVSQSLDQAKQRINQWYSSHLRDNPQTIGRVSLQLILQPWGGVSDIRLLAAEFSDPAFINGLRDRLEAVAMPAGAIDPVPVVLSMDFRP